jgi:DNA-binding NtrC family response regulator
MRPLHVQLLVADPAREDVVALADALRRGGHLVVTEAVDRVPPDVAPAPEFVVTEASAQPAPETLDAAEARHIAAMLRYVGGNRRQAAILLGVARSTLLAKIRKYGL